MRVPVIEVARYRCEVGRIHLAERFINLEMVRDGFSWRYVRYDKAGEFTDADREARETPRLVGGLESGAARGIPKGALTTCRRVWIVSRRFPRETSAP